MVHGLVFFFAVWNFKDELCSSLCGFEGDLAAGQQWNYLKTIPRKGRHGKKPNPSKGILTKTVPILSQIYSRLHPDVDFDTWNFSSN